MDPRVCMSLTEQAFTSWGYTVDAARMKLAMGAELGAQFGGCSSVTYVLFLLSMKFKSCFVQVFGKYS